MTRSDVGPGNRRLDPGVTFLVGESGSGKSTLVEAIAVAAGFNPEGGSRSFRFSTRPSYDEALPVQLTRRFLADPDSYLEILLG